MKFYVIFLAVLLSACNPEKPQQFLCITPFGVLPLFSNDPGVKIRPQYIKLTTETKIIEIPRSSCVEVTDK